MPQDSYVCRHCGYVLPTKEANVSGWDSESLLRIFIVLDVEK
jgi:hypothetical protein